MHRIHPDGMCSATVAMNRAFITFYASPDDFPFLISVTMTVLV